MTVLGNLLVADQGIIDPTHNGAVDVFAPGSHTPSRKITFNTRSSASVVLGTAGTHLFVGNYQTHGYNQLTVSELSYTAGRLVKSVPVLVRGAGGIAVSPRATF